MRQLGHVSVLRREESAEALRDVFTCRVGRPRTMRHLGGLDGRWTVPRDWQAERRGQLGRGHAKCNSTRRSHWESELLMSYGVMPCPWNAPPESESQPAEMLKWSSGNVV